MKQFLDFAYSLINYFRIFKVFSFLFYGWLNCVLTLCTFWRHRGNRGEFQSKVSILAKLKNQGALQTKKNNNKNAQPGWSVYFFVLWKGIWKFRGINHKFVSINLSLFRFLRIYSNWNQRKTSKLEVKDCFGKQ